MDASSWPLSCSFPGMPTLCQIVPLLTRLYAKSDDDTKECAQSSPYSIQLKQDDQSSYCLETQKWFESLRSSCGGKHVVIAVKMSWVRDRDQHRPNGVFLMKFVYSFFKQHMQILCIEPSSTKLVCMNSKKPLKAPPCLTLSNENGAQKTQGFCQPALEVVTKEMQNYEKQYFESYLRVYEKSMQSIEQTHFEMLAQSLNTFEQFLEFFKKLYIQKFKVDLEQQNSKSFTEQAFEKLLNEAFIGPVRHKKLFSTWRRVKVNPELRKKICATWKYVSKNVRMIFYRPMGACQCESLPLHESRWLEKMDLLHRYVYADVCVKEDAQSDSSGSKAKNGAFESYFDRWKNLKWSEVPKDPKRSRLGVGFFAWLREELSIHPPTTPIPVVHYLQSDEERASYELRVINGKCGTPKEPVLHTSNAKKFPHIFVISTSFKIYIGVYHRGYFHHSSFVGGKRVLGSGKILFGEGEIELVTNKSGHYRFGEGTKAMWEFVNFLHHKMNYIMSDVTISTGCAEETYGGKDSKEGRKFLVDKETYEIHYKQMMHNISRDEIKHPDKD